MFRLLQGDVGSGKTIISLIAAANVIRSNWQVAIMVPTEILAKQHYYLAKKIFNSTGVNIEMLTGKTDIRQRKLIHSSLINGKINLLIGTHALFQKKVIINYFKLSNVFNNILLLCVVFAVLNFTASSTNFIWKFIIS